MAAIIVKLECITNMHVGSGDVNYNIIDDEVEKDPVTGYPTINSSGVKGALKEHFNKDENLKQYRTKFFGTEISQGNTQGVLKVMSADMLAIPVRASKGNEAYYRVTTRTALDKFDRSCELFLGRINAREMEKVEGIAVEGIDLGVSVQYGKDKLYIISDEDFRRISLPVIARNKLMEGKSVLLWYEEIVPHESVFTFPVLANDMDREELTVFKDQIDGKIIQFGGNASVGYGFCKVTVMEEASNE